MKVSIITVSFNSKETISDAMESVHRQKRNGYVIEYIVVDGGSSDGTIEEIKQFENKVLADKDERFQFKWVSEKDDGLYDAMNKGIAISTGEVIGILNSDDMMAGNCVVESVVKEFEKCPSLEILLSDVRFVDSNIKLDGLKEARTRRFISPIVWHPWMLTIGYAPPHPGMYIRRTCFECWGYYKCAYRIGADYEMVVRFMRKNKAKRRYMKRCAVAMRLGGVSTKKGNIGSFIGNNHDVVAANKENGYIGSRLIILAKLPFKVIELLLPKFFPYIGSK